MRVAGFPGAACFGVASESDLKNRRQVALGFHDFHQKFSSANGAALSRLFTLG
jgi:hypothetical protein